MVGSEAASTFSGRLGHIREPQPGVTLIYRENRFTQRIRRVVDAAVAGILLQAFFGVLAFGFALLASICLGGPLSTGVREYALIFYGSRYQALGNLLYPPPVAGAPTIR